MLVQQVVLPSYKNLTKIQLVRIRVMHVWHGKHQSILYTLECTRAYPSWTPQVLLHSPHRIYQVLQSQACLKARARVITYKTAHKTGQLYKSTGCVT